MPDQAPSSILYGVDAGVATITLNRPEALNSFTAAMHQELAAALDRVAADASVRAILLTGAGRGFCAGQDLSDDLVKPDGAPKDIGIMLERYYNPLIERLRGLPLPIVCAVNGAAAGAGVSLALACDIVLAARSAAFMLPFCNIGLLPDSGATYMLPRLLGPARAAALAFTGEKLPAEKAAEWGLIWQAVDDDKLMETASKLAHRLAAAPTKGIAATKTALEAAWRNDLAAQLALERRLQGDLGYSHDYQEGVSAFLEKRKPSFKGC